VSRRLNPSFSDTADRSLVVGEQRRACANGERAIVISISLLVRLQEECGIPVTRLRISGYAIDPSD